jgi:ABC-type dipeptide/oligopeptide/nickel transport system permease subunit
MIIALVPNALALALATLVGVTAGVMRGKVEYVLMRVTEAIMVLPGFLIAMAVISTFGSSTTVLVLTLVAFSWTYTARVIYGETLRLARCSSSRRLSPSGRAGGGSPRPTSCRTSSPCWSSTSP